MSTIKPRATEKAAWRTTSVEVLRLVVAALALLALIAAFPFDQFHFFYADM